MLAVALLTLMTACNQKNNSEMKNPLFSESTLPFEAPQFDKIKAEHFSEAFEEGIKQHDAEIEEIANNPEAPSFENTLVALEKSGQLLNRTSLVMGVLSGAHTNEEIQKIESEMAPRLSAHRDGLYLNEKLFKRIEAIKENSEEVNKLDPESQRLVNYYYDAFVRAGAKLNEEDKTRLKAINEEDASLCTDFGNKLLAIAKENILIVDDVEALDGLSQSEINRAAEVAKEAGHEGKWALKLTNTTQQKELSKLTNRDTRRKFYELSLNRANGNDQFDTQKIITRLAEIRAEKAQILGFPNYASWKLQNQMAKSPDIVQEFLNKMIPDAIKKGKKDAAELQAYINKKGGKFSLEGYDWNYYVDKVRKEKYDLDQNEIRPYFQLDSVLQNGVFFTANRLYGISFKERFDLPVYHPDVRVFTVYDADGSEMALFYCDYFARDSKAGGAWMSNIVEQSKLLNQKPVIYNVCNFTKPAEGEPALISIDEAETLFHEFGHFLHGLFANQTYPSLSGTNVARDFVETPSQINEHWLFDPAVFSNFAKHYKTQEPMPQALLDKIEKSMKFNQAYSLLENLAAVTIDLQWHMLKPGQKIESAEDFEKEVLTKSGLYSTQIPPRYRSPYFRHIWSNGYSSGYYAYLWAEMLDQDIYQWFMEHGGLTRENGQRFRDKILSVGNTRDFNEIFREMTDRDPNVEPLLRARGLK